MNINTLKNKIKYITSCSSDIFKNYHLNRLVEELKALPKTKRDELIDKIKKQDTMNNTISVTLEIIKKIEKELNKDKK